MFEVHCCCEHQKLTFSLAIFFLFLAFEHPFCSSPSCTEGLLAWQPQRFLSFFGDRGFFPSVHKNGHPPGFSVYLKK